MNLFIVLGGLLMGFGFYQEFSKTKVKPIVEDTEAKAHAEQKKREAIETKIKALENKIATLKTTGADPAELANAETELQNLKAN